MKKSLRIITGILLLTATIGFALLPISTENKIEQKNNHINALNDSIRWIENNITQSYRYLEGSTSLSQHIELLKILQREDMIKEKYDEYMLRKYTALLSANNVFSKK